MSRHHITVGQRYNDTRLTMFGMPCRTVWVVDRIWQALDGLEYAELFDEGDSQHRKTLSTTALHDVNFFSPVMERRQAFGSKSRSIADAGEENLSALRYAFDITGPSWRGSYAGGRSAGIR
jgi:hypothetical protein